MGMPIQFTKVLAAANATNVAAAQAHSNSSTITLSGSPVVLDTQRRIAIALTSTANSGVLIALTGTNDSGTTISENITISGTLTAAASVMDYKTVSLVSATTISGNISIGTNGTGSTPWQMANPWSSPVNIFVAVSLPASGAATYSAEYTVDLDPCGVRNNTPLTAVNAFTAGLLSGLTTSGAALLGPGTAGIGVPLTAWRVTVTTGTGSCVVQAIEAGVGAG